MQQHNLYAWLIGKTFASAPLGAIGDYEAAMQSHRQRCEELVNSGKANRDGSLVVIGGSRKAIDTRLLKARARARLSG